MKFYKSAKDRELDEEVKRRMNAAKMQKDLKNARAKKELNNKELIKGIERNADEDELLHYVKQAKSSQNRIHMINNRIYSNEALTDKVQGAKEYAQDIKLHARELKSAKKILNANKMADMMLQSGENKASEENIDVFAEMLESERLDPIAQNNAKKSLRSELEKFAASTQNEKIMEYLDNNAADKTKNSKEEEQKKALDLLTEGP